MSAKVMQLVNSAFFGRHTNIDSIGKAVNVLGVETIKSLTQSVNVFTEINTDTANLFPVQALWKHSLRVALLAQVIAKTESAPKALVQTAFVAGFMHDIGKLFLATRFQDKYFDTIELAKTQKIPLHQAEQHLLKATHGEVGGYLLGLWGFPDAVVDAAYRHHKNLDYTMENSFSLALAVHVADVLCHGLYPESPLSEPVLNRSPLERASTGRFARWFALSRRMAL